MNGYIGFYKGKRVEVHAETQLAAQLAAARAFGVKPNKSYTVNVVLAEKDGVPVIHSTASI